MASRRKYVWITGVVVAVVAAVGYVALRPPPSASSDDWSGVCRTPSSGVPRGNTPPTQVETVATGLCVPWGLAFLPDGTALISERDTARLLALSVDGRITEVQRFTDARPGGRPPGPGHGGEGGLLGLAVSPTYT